MTFTTTLNGYCASLACTNKELAARCGISDSALSRYRKGERTPELNGGRIPSIAEGIASLLGESGIDNPPSASEVQHALETSILQDRQRGIDLCARVNDLMLLLKIKNTELAAALKVGPSYLSRIRSKQRIPSDQSGFAQTCAKFAAGKCQSKAERQAVATLLGKDALTENELEEALANWLTNEEARAERA